MPIGSGGRKLPPKINANQPTVYYQAPANPPKNNVNKVTKKAKQAVENASITGDIEIKLINRNSTISKKIKEAMKEKIKDKFVEILIDVIQEFQLRLEEEIKEAILESDIYASLSEESELGGDLGVSDSTLDLFEDNIHKLFSIKLDQNSAQSSGGPGSLFQIAFNIDPNPLPEDLSDTSLGFAYYTGAGELKTWLAYLLYGDDNYNPGHTVVTSPGFGRTNIKIMVETDGVDYKLKSDIAGSVSNHWVIDTITDIFPDLQRIFKKTLEDNIAKTFRPS